MELVLGGLIVLAALAIYNYGPQIYGKWLNRKKRGEDDTGLAITVVRVGDPCVECGRKLADGQVLEGEEILYDVQHRVVERPGDELEADLSRNGGGTAFIADFCPNHCPGGCKRECEVPA